jgi:hypothetical protein
MSCANCASVENENAILRDEIQRLITELDEMRREDATIACANACSSGTPSHQPDSGAAKSSHYSSDSNPHVERLSEISSVVAGPQQEPSQVVSARRGSERGGADALGGSVILATGSLQGEGGALPTGDHEAALMMDDDERTRAIGHQTILNYQHFHHQISDVQMQLHELRDQIKLFASSANRDAQQLIYSAIKPYHARADRQRIEATLGALKREVQAFQIDIRNAVAFALTYHSDPSEKQAIQQLHQTVLHLASVSKLAHDIVQRQADCDKPTAANLSWKCEPTLAKAMPFALQALESIGSSFAAAMEWSRLSVLRMSALEAKAARLEREKEALSCAITEFAGIVFRQPTVDATALRTADQHEAMQAASAAGCGGGSSADFSATDAERLLGEVLRLYVALARGTSADGPTQAAPRSPPRQQSAPAQAIRVVVDNCLHREGSLADGRLIAEAAHIRKRLARIRFVAAARFIVKQIARARCGRVLQMVAHHLAMKRRQRWVQQYITTQQQQVGGGATSPSHNGPVLRTAVVDGPAPLAGSVGRAVGELEASWRRNILRASVQHTAVGASPRPTSQRQHVVPADRPARPADVAGAASPPASSPRGKGLGVCATSEDAVASGAAHYSKPFFTPAPPISFKVFMSSLRSQQQPGAGDVPPSLQAHSFGSVGKQQVAANKIVLPRDDSVS